MNTALKKVFFTIVAFVALFSLICSVAASTVLNSATMGGLFGELPSENKQILMEKGIAPSQYGAYAVSLCNYLSGQGEMCVIRDSEGNLVPAFSDTAGRNGESKQNVHLKDVRGITMFLIRARYFGGGGALAVLAGLYIFCRLKKKPFPAKEVLFGFMMACVLLIVIVLAVALWAVIDFNGFFYQAHTLIFTGNDYWLLDNSFPLMAFMPQSFFEAYAGKLLWAELPIFGIMVCLIILYFKFKKDKNE